MLTLADRALAPLDRARGVVLRGLVRQPWLHGWLASRDRRIAAVAAIGIVVTFLLTLGAPAAVYAISPIVFGVPHVASDVRYLIVRQRLPRLALGAVIALCAAIFATRIAEMVWPGTRSWARVELGLAASGAIALAWFAALQHKSRRRVWLWTVGVGVCFGAVLRFPTAGRLVLAHLHNVVAVVIWLLLFRRSARALWLPLSLLVGATALILGGVTLPVVIAASGHEAFGQSLLDVADWLAPGLGMFGISLTLAYVFLQSIHYAVWLGWIPQEETRGQGSLTFRQSLRSLRHDFGAVGIAVVVASMLALAGCAMVSLHRTRDLYLFLAGFHAYLELALLGYLLVRRPAIA